MPLWALLHGTCWSIPRSCLFGKPLCLHGKILPTGPSQIALCSFHHSGNSLLYKELVWDLNQEMYLLVLSTMDHFAPTREITVFLLKSVYVEASGVKEQGNLPKLEIRRVGKNECWSNRSIWHLIRRVSGLLNGSNSVHNPYQKNLQPSIFFTFNHLDSY